MWVKKVPQCRGGFLGASAESFGHFLPRSESGQLGRPFQTTAKSGTLKIHAQQQEFSHRVRPKTVGQALVPVVILARARILLRALQSCAIRPTVSVRYRT